MRLLSLATFSSTATAFVLLDAPLVFVDVRPDTMHIDETKNCSMGEGGALIGWIVFGLICLAYYGSLCAASSLGVDMLYKR